MTTLHTFGCSITQGFALPDVVKPILDEDGQPLTRQQLDDQGIEIYWEDIHVYAPSDYAWPKVLADRLGIPVINHARRGACFQQIARQCAVGVESIQPGDTVIVMWTYLSRLSLQWPARTSVPFCNVPDPQWNFRTVMRGFNKFFGLERSNTSNNDAYIQKYIETATKTTYLDPLGVYDRFYNSLILQQMTDGFLRATGARIIHLSVENQPSLEQLEDARNKLPASLKSPQKIPHPTEWYNIQVDHDSCLVIHDPSIPPAENDMHPSVQHHQNFAQKIHDVYF